MLVVSDGPAVFGMDVDGADEDGSEVAPVTGPDVDASELAPVTAVDVDGSEVAPVIGPDVDASEVAPVTELDVDGADEDTSEVEPVLGVVGSSVFKVVDSLAEEESELALDDVTVVESNPVERPVDVEGTPLSVVISKKM